MISVPITVEQLITAVQQLQPAERSQVVDALIKTDLNTDMAQLIKELYAQPAVEDISDADINAEIKAVRQQRSS